MALTFNGTSQYISRSGAILSAAPMTFACWFNPASTTVNSCLINIASQSTNTTYFMLYADSSATLTARTVAASSGSSSVTTGTLTVGTWAHCAAVFASSTSRTAYLNGTAATPSTISLTPSFNSPITAIGANFSGNTTAVSLMNGTAAWPAIWNIALSSSDITALAGGLHPLRVHPEALVSCPMLQGNSPEIDIVSSTTWTTTASPVLAANPSIYMAREALTFTPSALSATATFSPETILTLSAQMAQQPSLSMSPETILVEQQQVLDNATVSVSPETILALGPSLFTPNIFATATFNPGTSLTLNANDFVTAIINQYLIFPPGNINESHLQQ